MPLLHHTVFKFLKGEHVHNISMIEARMKFVPYTYIYACGKILIGQSCWLSCCKVWNSWLRNSTVCIQSTWRICFDKNGIKP
jgi:hypothetical protein